MMRQRKSRNWTFTLNNPEEEDKPEDGYKNIRFLVYQLEQGKEETPHYQGFVSMKTSYTHSCMRKKRKRAILFPARGTALQNLHYCSKPHGPTDECYDQCSRECKCDQCRKARKPPAKRLAPTIIFGAPPNDSGFRNEIKEVKRDVKEGKTMNELWREHPSTMVRYYKAIAEMMNQLGPQRAWKTEVIVVYGPAGVGKSTLVRLMTEDVDFRTKNHKRSVYTKQSSNKWFPGYGGESIVKLENFNGNWMDFTTLLGLMSEDPYTVEMKGGNMPFLARQLFITTTVHPINWYNMYEVQGELRELTRRIDLFVDLRERYKPLYKDLYSFTFQ